jgi:hypothetical protein
VTKTSRAEKQDRGLGNWVRKHWWAALLGFLTLVGLTDLTHNPLADLYGDRLLALISKPYQIGVIPVIFGGNKYPNCSVFEISLVPRKKITELHLNLTFEQEIRSARIRQVRLKDYSGKHGNQLKGDVSLQVPCDFKDEPQASDTTTLSLGLSSDRRTVFITGHDLIPEESREIVLLLYPDYTIQKRFPAWHQRTTYTILGREIPGCLVLEPLHASFGDVPYVPITGSFNCAATDGVGFNFSDFPVPR